MTAEIVFLGGPEDGCHTVVPDLQPEFTWAVAKPMDEEFWSKDRGPEEMEAAFYTAVYRRTRRLSSDGHHIYEYAP